MEWQTKIEIPQAGFHIGYHSRILMLGSCFTENIGEKLTCFKFDADINPCGIVYNPMSAMRVLELVMEGEPFTADRLMQHDGKWLSLLHHGSFSSPDRETCLHRINERLAKAADRLKTTDMLVITFGTAWVFRYKRDGGIVSNCHKLPASEFERFRLEPEEIAAAYILLIRRLREINPALRILFTVSPIRHWKDGAHGNQLSKSVLLLAIDRLVRDLENVYYFPSYEIVMDELRDYRFYAEDMLHVSPVAVEYIWERFRDTYIGKDALGLMARIDKVNKTLSHRPADAGSEKWQRLWEKNTAEMAEIETVIRRLRAKE